MDAEILYQQILQKFSYTPTKSQNTVLQELSFFITHRNTQNIFLLKGFAGTGKTTIIATIVKLLKDSNIKVILLAPTGRSAKVITKYAREKAYTIHKYIYYPKNVQNKIHFVLKSNKDINTIYIIDEASMISNTNGIGENSVLEDLIQYAYSGTGCKIIFVGDTAQLPPIDAEVSPALNAEHLTFNYSKTIIDTELTEVVRQKRKSGILQNATALRKLISQENHLKFQFKINSYTDIVRLQGNQVQEALQQAYEQYGIDQTALIVHTNKRATLYNQQIRKVIFDNEDALSVGDLLMVVKNDYFWLDPKSEAGFIANGDTIEVLEIIRFEQVYGFSFAEVKAQLIDYPNLAPFQTMLLLDTLTSFSPALSWEQNNKLYQEVVKNYQNESHRYRKLLKIKNDPYFNALQVKFSYAITCHKSQGGQWDMVFIDRPFIANEPSINYFRWLYTAMTRAKKRLYLLGFTNDDFQDYDDFFSI